MMKGRISMNQIQPMDWSATAAWIALAISIIGTIAGPIITTILTNRHQIKLRTLELKEKQTDEINKARIMAIENFISNVGKVLANPARECIRECGEHFFQVYAYIPHELWDDLDLLYDDINEYRWDPARTRFNNIAKSLAVLLKESRQ